ncbi:restriction endonuclease subunit S [Sulfuriferula thiophila]|uniref:restriction endonuclease subunit S n=1 Tax=Sulfuriferula thiophila TaxID=1781211 RepID=UPI000F6094E1|nr:restriction endonuclease subunit S [Sulfuriferula thiophila]
MNAIQQLLTDHIDIWTQADTEKKSGRGRSSGNAASVYGIRKLRELILELAVRGKLVPQDANDEPASELLKRIQAEKAKLIAEGKIKKSKSLAPISDEERPFEVPHGWVWARLDSFVLSILSGGTPSKNNSEFWNGDIPWASVKDLNVDKFLESTQDHITEDGLEAGSKLANKGDLLICTRMGLGKIAIAAMDVAINQDLKALKITSQLDIGYFIKFYSTLKIVGSGMTVAGIRQDELLGYCVPTPPLAEQRRIVTKVDELMALCDQLETQHNNAAVAHEKLVSQLLGTLTLSQSAADFSANWQRIAAHFDTLFTTETSIELLKQTLLQLAVMGKLVPQDPNDEPACELLKRIQAEKARLVADGKIKKDKPLAPISDEEKSFELPQGWEWVRLKDIVYVLGDGLHGTPTYTPNSECYFVNGNNLDNGQITIKPETKTVSLDEMKKHRKSLNERTVLVSINGTIGNVAFYNNENIILGKSACYFNLANLIYKHFVKVLIESPYFMEYALNSVSGTTIMNLSLFSMNNFPLSIPPLAEQHRIVAKVDELMAICDQLKSRITAASQLQQKLADVLVEQAVT